MAKQYSKSPLPFLGQKRNWLKQIREIDFSGMTVVDLFGGSGIVSHTIQDKYPTARVIWNDYDNFQARLEVIEQTEALRQELQAIPHGKKVRTSEEIKERMLEIINRYDSIDWITLSSWLLFPANYAHDYDDLKGRSWYASVPKSALTSEGYLEGVERRSADFRELIKEFKGKENVIFIADPPYVMTNQSGYVAKGEDHFKLKDSIELIIELHTEKALFFSSPKSESDALFEVYQPQSIERIEFATSIVKNRIKEYMFLLNFNTP